MYFLTVSIDDTDGDSLFVQVNADVLHGVLLLWKQVLILLVYHELRGSTASAWLALATP